VPAKTKGKTYHVYVVELDRKVWSESWKFREANPRYKGLLECLYVGMTSKTPQERLKIHKTGGRSKKGYKISSRYVETYGKYLRPSLYTHLNPMTRKDAMEMEGSLANELKKKGYAVWWN